MENSESDFLPSSTVSKTFGKYDMLANKYSENSTTLVTLRPGEHTSIAISLTCRCGASVVHRIGWIMGLCKVLFT